MKCRRCKVVPAQVALPSHKAGFCPECFFLYFRRQVERAIKDHAMLTPEDRALVCLSGGKDSLSLMRELAELGYNVTGLHIDLSIGDSSDHARALVEDFCAKHDLPLMVKRTAEEGLAIPDVKRHLCGQGRNQRPVCSLCGKIKRHIFNRTALQEGFDMLATGHNLDDESARLFANTLRWDTAYLGDTGPSLPAEGGFARKVKPLYRLSEFETAAYAYLNGIDYNLVPCPYSPGATFTGHKTLIQELEDKHPGMKIHFYDGFLKRARAAFASIDAQYGAELSPCAQCGSPSSVEVCGVCSMRERLADKMVAEE